MGARRNIGHKYYEKIVKTFVGLKDTSESQIICLEVGQGMAASESVFGETPHYAGKLMREVWH